jgi:hypothetical protein
MEPMKYICISCITEPFLRCEIESKASDDYSCDYCTGGGPAAPISAVATRCNEVLHAFYDDSSQTMAVIYHERIPSGQDFPETIENMAGVTGDVAADVVEVLEKEWPDEPWFVRRRTVDSPLPWEWSQMEISLRSEARFFNPKVSRFMERIFGEIASDVTAEGLSVLVDVGPASEHRAFYRARVFQSDQDIEKALCHPEKWLGAPSMGMGNAGRMNTAGQPAFYGASLQATALAEVRPPVGSQVVVARFDIVRPLKLLNLALLAQVQIPHDASLFDPATMASFQRRDFLEALSQRMTVPVMPEDQNRNYLITQVIADYLAMHTEVNIDGILYPSVQVSNGPHVAENMNVVLFYKAAMAIDADLEDVTTIAEIWTSHDEGGDEYDEYDPKIYLQPIKKRRYYLASTDQSEPALQLDPKSIVIHKVTSVTINTSPTSVRLVSPDQHGNYG